MSHFFDHSHHRLRVQDLDIDLDVLAFRGEEHLSQPFTYWIEFTSSELDIAADQLLNHDARFCLFAANQPPLIRGLPKPEIEPLRTLHGVITGFKRLSDSVDEAHYEITLQPRLALLGRGQQFRIYQHKSVPEIVEHILRSRHHFEASVAGQVVTADQPKFEGGSVLLATKKETTAAMFTLLQTLDGPGVGAALSILVCVLLGVHFVTTADAGTQVLCTLCAVGSTNPPNWIRLLWCVLEGAIAAGLLLAGGLKAIQMASIAAGLPIALLLMVMSYTLIHSLRREMPGDPAWTPAADILPRVERREVPMALAAAGA